MLLAGAPLDKWRRRPLTSNSHMSPVGPPPAITGMLGHRPRSDRHPPRAVILQRLRAVHGLPQRRAEGPQTSLRLPPSVRHPVTHTSTTSLAFRTSISARSA